VPRNPCKPQPWPNRLTGQTDGLLDIDSDSNTNITLGFMDDFMEGCPKGN